MAENATEKTKVIGLDNLDVIGQYISENNKILSDKIDFETKKYLNEKLDEAAGKIASDYNDKYGKLTSELERLKAEGSDANKDLIKELELKLDALEHDTKDMYEALDGIDNELKRLDSDLSDGLKSIFSEGQINELLHAALIEKTTITDDMIETPNLYCTNLVALIAKFGKITAAQIEAGDITGHTIASNTNIPGTETPIWKIDNYGDGHLASENIKWDRNGNVTFGPGVTVKWDNIEGGNEVKNSLDKFEQEREDLKNSITTNREEVNKLINDWGSDNLLSPAEITSLKRLVDEITIEYNGIIEKLNDLRDLYKKRVENTDMDKEIKTEFYNKLNDIVSDNSSFIVSYEKAIEICNYYINSKNTNANGCVAIDNSHPLSDINEYYKERDAVLAVYYDASTFYTTYDRFGSKTTWIGENGIYSGAIMGDHIKGWNIEGLTIGSAATTDLPDYVNWQKFKSNAEKELDAFETRKGGIGPAWQIRRNGDGHLAGGQISWNDSEIILGDKVSIRWAQVSDGDSVIDDINDSVDSKIAKVKESIDGINKTLIDAGVGSGDGSGGSSDPNWSPDIASIKERLSELEGFNTTIFKDGIYTGTVIAQNIAGDQIAGVSLYAGVGSDNNYNGSAFAVKEDGTGWLANKAFKWSKENGEWKVTLGKGVEIIWGEDGVEKPTGSGGSGVDETTVKNLIAQATKLGEYQISSGIVAGNLVQGTDNVILEKDTKYYTIADKDNGVINENEANGTFDKGPSWQITGNKGTGYLAAGKISWDNTDLYINGDAVAKGLTEAKDDDLLKEVGKIVAPYVDAGTVAVNELFTKTENESDSVNIKNNYVHVVNKEGIYNISLSSDSIADANVDNFICEYNTNSIEEVKSISLSSSNGNYVNSGNINLCNASLGYITSGAAVNLGLSVMLLKGTVIAPTNNLKTSDWTINYNNIANNPSIPNNNATGVFANIYKLTNGSKEYIKSEKLDISCESANPFSCSTGTSTKYYYNLHANVIIDNPGIYSIEYVINKNTINSTIAATGFVAGAQTLINNGNTSSVTEIGKDGLLSYDGINTLLMSKNGIHMVSKDPSSSTGFYGFKVTSNGIFYSNGDYEWKQWNP